MRSDFSHEIYLSNHKSLIRFRVLIAEQDKKRFLHLAYLYLKIPMLFNTCFTTFGCNMLLLWEQLPSFRFSYISCVFLYFSPSQIQTSVTSFLLLLVLILVIYPNFTSNDVVRISLLRNVFISFSNMVSR